MSHLETARALRADTQVHYNCCQSVLVPFAAEMGLTEAQAFALGANFGSGMLHGSVCGTLSGAMMVLGASGYDSKQAGTVIRAFQEQHGSTACAELLKASRERGLERKTHCDGLVLEVVQMLDQMLGQG